MMVATVEEYFIDGCGRCKLFRTPDCKVHRWKNELMEFRAIALESGLEESIKWGQLTYSFKGKNVLIVASFKEYTAMMFIKGAHLADNAKILIQPTENTNNARQIRVKNVQEITKNRTKIAAYIQEAIELEKQGVKSIVKKVEDFAFPEELTQKFEENKALKDAFFKLTPGRQKAYLLYFSQAKQAKTRIDRIEKYTATILAGKGIND